MEIIYSIGHSNRAFSEFLHELQEHKVNTLIDVRTFPRSRFCPQYNRKYLEEELGKEKIAYLFKGKNLGGKGENIEYEETIDKLVEMARIGKQICVMCSEADYMQCHRYEILEPSFTERGVKIKHIVYGKKS